MSWEEKPKETSDKEREQEKLEQFLQNEYKVVADAWKFLSGLRFAVLAFAATLQSALFGAYQYFITNPEKLKEFGRIAEWGIPAFGGISIIATALIESRTRRLYGTCLKRAQKIEDILLIKGGIFHRLWETPLWYQWASHTRVIAGMYLILGLIWLTLAIKGLI